MASREDPNKDDEKQLKQEMRSYVTFDEELTEEEKLLQEKFKALREMKRKVECHFGKLESNKPQDKLGVKKLTEKNAEEATVGTRSASEVNKPVRSVKPWPPADKEVKRSGFKKPVKLQRKLESRYHPENGSKDIEKDKAEDEAADGTSDAAGNLSKVAAPSNAAPVTPSDPASVEPPSTTDTVSKWSRITLREDLSSGSDSD